MRYLFSIFLITFIILSSTSTYADFFDQSIIMSDPEVTMIENITLNYVNFNNAKEVTRFNNTSYFIKSIKDEAITRFNNGTIPLYRRHDIVTHFDSFTYIMNQYFFYRKKYEQTWNDTYKEEAQLYLEDARGAYDRLKDTLGKSAY